MPGERYKAMYEEFVCALGETCDGEGIQLSFDTRYDRSDPHYVAVCILGTDTNSERHEGRAYDSHETAKGSAAALALWGTRTAWRDPKQWSRLDKTRTTVMDICTRYGLRALEEACHVPAAYTQLEPLDHPDWEFPSRYQISLRSTTEDITSSSLTVTANRGAESLSPQALVSDSSEPFSSSACSSSETATASARDLAVPAGLSSEGGQAPANAMAAPVDANSKCQAPEKKRSGR